MAACYKEEKPAAELLDEAQTDILRVSQSQSLHGVVEAKDLAHEVLEQIELAHKEKRAVTGVPSGLRVLDKKTAGFQKSDLILIAARPSQGKTALALNIASHVALEEKLPVLLFSLEMSRHAIMQRFISSEARVNLMSIRTGFFQPKDWTRLTNAAARFSEAPLHVVDMSSLSVLGVRSISRQLAAKLKREGKKLALVVIDYLQLMRGSGTGGEPPAGGRRHLPRPQGAGPGPGPAGHRPFSAFPPLRGQGPRRQQARALGPARERRSGAGRGPGRPSSTGRPITSATTRPWKARPRSSSPSRGRARSGTSTSPST